MCIMMVWEKIGFEQDEQTGYSVRIPLYKAHSDLLNSTAALC